MRSRWVVVSALVVAIGLAWAGAAATDASKSPAPAVAPAPQTAPASDPYVGASPITTKAPDERKPCTFFNSDCANKQDGQHCGPALGHCLCSVLPGSYSCVSGGPIS